MDVGYKSSKLVTRFEIELGRDIRNATNLPPMHALDFILFLVSGSTESFL